MINYNVLNYPQPVIDRFWSKVKVIYNPDGTPDFDSCMIWTAGKFRNGYGNFSFNGKRIGSHKFIYICFYGNIPEDMKVCHIYDNPPCVNPYHLFVGTHKQNMQDRDIKCRCARGETSGMSKLTELDITNILYDVSNNLYSSIISIARKYYVSSPAIQDILNGEHWTHITIPLCNKLGITLQSLHDKFNIIGSKHPQSKLIESQVSEIKNRLRNREKLSDLAKRFNISIPIIYKIKNNEIWTHVK
jgi:hypothetical protein